MSYSCTINSLSFCPRNISIKAINCNPFLNKPWFLCACSTSLLKTRGKGEIADNEQFLLFPQCFLPIQGTFFHFYQI